jgi:transcriptional regulator with XRE-family HTH domain
VASLGLKLFYLRTREKKLSQRDVATKLSIRQGTVSFLEQGVTAPHWALVVDLCKFYDVTPTYLADETRGVVPRATERWGLRDSLITLGMWVELEQDSAEDLGNKRLIYQLAPGSKFFDEEAAEVRRRYKREANSRSALTVLRTKYRTEERDLEKQLIRELREHPRRRGKLSDS